MPTAFATEPRASCVARASRTTLVEHLVGEPANLGGDTHGVESRQVALFRSHPSLKRAAQLGVGVMLVGHRSSVFADGRQPGATKCQSVWTSSP